MSINNPLQQAMENANKWLYNRNLIINIDKTATIRFSRKQFNTSIPLIKLNGIRIQRLQKYKFLGMVFDERLTWKYHIQYLKEKCLACSNIIKYISKKWWGAHLQILILLYNNLINSKIDYGCFLHEITYKSYYKILNSIQYQILKQISGINGNIAKHILINETGSSPRIWRNYILSAKYIIKVLPNLQHPLIPKLQLLSEKYNPFKITRNTSWPTILSTFQYFINKPYIKLPMPTKYMLPYKVQYYKIQRIHTSTITNQQIIHQIYNLNSIETTNSNISFIFTDGSKNHLNQTGAAVYNEDHKIHKHIKLPPDTSIFTAETIAIRHALIEIKNKQITNAVICSDSMSAILAITKPNINIYENWYIANSRHLFYKLDKANIHIAWIPAHRNIIDNEIVDELAKRAAQEDNTKIHSIELPVSDFVRNYKTQLKDRRSKEWESHNNNSYYYHIQPSVLYKPWFHDRKYNRSTITLIIQLRTKTFLTPALLYKFRKRDNPYCLCQAYGDLDHVILGCPLNKYNINKFLQKLRINKKLQLPVSIAFLLNLNNNMIQDLIQFILQNRDHFKNIIKDNKSV